MQGLTRCKNLNIFPIVKGQKLPSDIYTALAWAIFTLGASQLALVLGGPITLFVILFCCASLFALFLFKVEAPGRRSFKQIAKSYLLSTGILLPGNLLYSYVVLLKPQFSNLIVVIVDTLLFIIPLVIAVPFLRRSSDVSQ